jgi:hypothetical protein
VFENSSDALTHPSSALRLNFAPLREKASRKGAGKEKPKPQRVELGFSRWVRREGTSRNKTS